MPKRTPPSTPEAKELIGLGLGIGAFGIISTALIGATCPLCVVAAPTLVGAGLYKSWRAKRNNRTRAPR